MELISNPLVLLALGGVAGILLLLCANAFVNRDSSTVPEWRHGGSDNDAKPYTDGMVDSQVPEDPEIIGDYVGLKIALGFDDSDPDAEITVHGERKQILRLAAVLDKRHKEGLQLIAMKDRFQKVESNLDGWVIGNGSQSAYRCFTHGMVDWTPSMDAAIRFSRREDAEQFSQEDEDGWYILPFIPATERT